jgi:hypothetical protein
MVEILPNSICQRSSKRFIWAKGTKWIPLFCANCGADGGLVMETDWEQVKNWAFYLCDPCAEKWAPLANVGIVPDELFWKAVHEEQLALYGRELTPVELTEALKDDCHPITLLAKKRHDFQHVSL